MLEYNSTDQNIHFLSQILAKLNRTFVPAEKDDSHTNLYFDPLSHRIFGRWIRIDGDNIITALNLGTFHIEVIDDEQNVLKEFEIEGHTMDNIECTIESSLSEFGLISSGFRDKLHYKIPNYGFFTKPFEKWSEKQIKQWESIRELANRSAYLLLGTLQSASEVRIWPHHFDTGIYTQPNSKIGLGYGLAMKDEMAGDAYYYFAGYSLNSSAIDYESINDLKFGQWEINKNWKGAILPISNLKENPSKIIQTFIKEVSEFYLG
jgi:hypothetical protein